MAEEGSDSGLPDAQLSSSQWLLPFWGAEKQPALQLPGQESEDSAQMEKEVILERSLCPVT